MARKSTKAQVNAERTKAVVDKMAGMTLLGEIVTWNPRTDCIHTYADVCKALEAAGMSTDLCREFLPRNAFARACRKMQENRLVDVVRDGIDEMVFQFTRKFMEDNAGEQEWAYKKELMLRLNKHTGKVTCKDSQMETLAQNNLNDAMDKRTTGDITRIVQKVFSGDADLFPIRDQGGAYFVPEMHTGLVAQVELFLEKLGGKVRRFPVPAGTQYGDKSTQEAVEEGLQQVIREHKCSVSNFSINTRKDTIEAAAEKIKATRVKVEAYAMYLADRREGLLKELDVADDELREQIAKLAQLQAEQPKVEKKPGEPAGKDQFDCRLGSQAATINATLSKEPKTLEAIVTESGLPVGRVKSHLKSLMEDGHVVEKDGTYAVKAKEAKKAKSKKRGTITAEVADAGTSN